LTYPAAAPDRRIDYVTVSAKIGVRSVRVPYTLASDHLPVVADLTVTRGARTDQTDHHNAHFGRTLRYGSPAQAGLLAEHVARIAPDAAAFTEPGPGGSRPFYPGFVVLTARRGVIVEHTAGGHAARYASSAGAELPPGDWIPMREDTIFDVASISKLFTAVVTMQLVERGLLDLDVPVARYIPEFASNGKQAVTLRHLLTHTAGLPAGLSLDPYPSIPQRLAAIYEVPARAEPGTSYLYSDLSLIVVGKVLERVTGEPLDQLVRERISQPLGLRDTMHNPPASLRPRIAPTEWQEGGRGLIWGEVHDRTSWLLGGTAGHAGVFSTARDLAVFAQTLLNGGHYGTVRILSPQSVRAMWTNGNAHLGAGAQRGFGFDMYRHSFMGAMATPSTVGHTGFTGTSLVIDPATDAFVILLTNRVHPTRTWAPDIGQARRAVAGDLARAIAVRPAEGRTAWFADNAPETGTPSTATLTLPFAPPDRPARLEFSVWWDTETCCDQLTVETATDDATGWTPLSLTLRAGTEVWQSGGELAGPGRRWHRASAVLPAGTSRVRWRYATDGWWLGRGVYVDAVRISSAGRIVFEDSRPADDARWQADGFTRSPD
jgi:CubicO group peptidase (beta-lactamase class C family)